MFRKLTSALYQVTHQQLLATLTRTNNVNLRNNTYGSIAQSFLNYELPLKTNYNKKITIVGSEKTSLPMAKNCLDRDVCQQICIMDFLQDTKDDSKSNILQYTSSPYIKATKHFQDTRNSDLIILTKDIQRLREKSNSIRDTLEQYTNVMKNLIPNLVKYSPNTIFLIDTEQADVVTYVAWKLSRLPKNRVLNPREIEDYIQEPQQNHENVKEQQESNTADVAAKIIENYHRILLSTLPQVKLNEENSSKFSQIFKTNLFKTNDINLINKDFNDYRKIII